MSSTADSAFRKAPTELTDIIGSILRAIKNYALYPEGHENRIQSLERCHKALSSYLEIHDHLRLGIGKDRLIFQGETLYSSPPAQGNLPFVLFRDGIQRLEFFNGIDVGELKSFLELLDRYWVLTDEPEGDLVTALWDARLPHIRYVVSDLFWGSEPETHLDGFSLNGASDTETQALDDAGGEPAPSDSDRNSSETARLDGPPSDVPDWAKPIDPEAIELTPEELERLFDGVIQEEKKDPSADFIHIIIDSLLEIREPGNLEIVFDTLRGVFQSLLDRKDWETASVLLEEVKEVRRRHPDPPDGYPERIEGFFSQIADSSVLSVLEKTLPELVPEQMESVKKMLLLFNPDVIPTLCRMLSPDQSFEARQMITAVIETLASRDVRPLESMLDAADASRLPRLISILGRLQGQRIDAILRTLLRHPYAGVRRDAATAMMRRSPENLRRLFFLIEDPDESVRRLILGFISRFRDPALEDMMRDYIRGTGPLLEDKAYLLACFNAWGFCGSSRSIPFLEGILNAQRWTDLFRKNVRVSGALLALKNIGTSQARAVLEKANRSLRPGIRRAAKEALKD